MIQGLIGRVVAMIIWMVMITWAGIGMNVVPTYGPTHRSEVFPTPTGKAPIQIGVMR